MDDRAEIARDEIASIYLYTGPARPVEQSFYVFLNNALASRDPAVVTPFASYVLLLLEAMRRMPAHYEAVYRAVGINLRAYYGTARMNGEVVTWPRFSSCSVNVTIANDFLEGEPTGTIFAVTLTTGRARNISQFSTMPNEEEVLLSPNSRFTVSSVTPMEGHGFFVQLREVSPVDPILESRGEGGPLWSHCHLTEEP